MCFSATASFVASAVLVIIGVLTLKKVQSREAYPLACIPLLFAIQQFTEGVIWVSFGSPIPHTSMVYLYTLFSHVLWPFYIPLSVWLIEKNSVKKKIISFFSVMGAFVSLHLLYIMVAYPVTAEIVNASVKYNLQYNPYFDKVIMLMYFLAVSVSCLFSSEKKVRILGVSVGLAFVIAYQFYTVTLFSVWCFFSAVISIYIVYIIRRSKERGYNFIVRDVNH